MTPPQSRRGRRRTPTPVQVRITVSAEPLDARKLAQVFARHILATYNGSAQGSGTHEKTGPAVLPEPDWPISPAAAV